MRKRISQEMDEASVDITPMLDVVFIMLIFFIVTTSFVKEAGIEINRPSAATSESQDSASIFVAISERGEIWIDNRRVDVSSVRANVERLRAESPEGTVVIQADKFSQTGILVEVVDQVRAAGVENVFVASEE